MTIQDTQDRHVPVLLGRIVELLAPALTGEGAVLLDVTLGMGGHSEALLAACPAAYVVGVDRDPQAIALASERLARYADRFRAVHAVYDDLDAIADALPGPVTAVLADLGVSSLQLDEVERGFAYRTDAPLDMRMDPTHGRSAADLLNTADAGELTAILRDYGEERYAQRIARAVVRARDEEPFAGSARLVALLDEAIPAAARRAGGHPAKRTFQALRIAVNEELSTWQRAWPALLDLLAVGGRAAVLSYHSLEDRITKRELTARTHVEIPPGLPVRTELPAPEFTLLTRGAERPGPQEVRTNPRAASARLRAAERIHPARSER